MCMCSKSMNMSNLHPCGSNCVNLGPFRAVRPGCTPPNMGSIIAFSSGSTELILPTLDSGLPGTPSLLGFGTAVAGTPIVGGTMNLTGILTEAFSVPRNGSITAISASFSTTAPVTVTGNASVIAQIYRAPAGSSIFTATNARVTLTPPFSGAVADGTTAFASADVSPIPVSQGDRLVMVYTLTGTAPTVTTLAGTGSAGITIS